MKNITPEDILREIEKFEKIINKWDKKLWEDEE